MHPVYIITIIPVGTCGHHFNAFIHLKSVFLDFVIKFVT